MDDYEGNGLAAFNDARSRGWSGSVTLADLEKLSAGNPIMQGIAAVWPDAPQTKPQSSVDWLRQYLPSSMGDWLARSESEGLQWGKDMSNPRTAAGEVISTAMNLVPMGRMAVPRSGIRAYHGSPYDFDRFDLSKIGTGEGAQAYGHGLYFAENPKTAQSYRDNLRGPPPVGDSSSGALVIHALRKADQDIPAALASLRQKIGESPFTRDVMNASHQARVAEAIKSLEQMNPGKMYEVNISAKPEQFLDWDRPLGQQPVFDAIRESKDIFGRLPWDRGRAASPTPGSTGRDAYDAIASNIRRGAAESGKPIDPHLSYPMASDALRGAGIPGIRYLDAGSRGVEGKQTSNYVLFNDKIVDIMKKWSLAGAIPFAAASDYDGRF